MLRSLAPLTGYLRRERPKALVSAMSHTNVVSLWAAKLAGGTTPVLVTIHTTHSKGTRHPGLTHRVQPRLMRIFYPWASRIIAVSGGVADDVARSTGVPRERVEVIYNPVISRATLTSGLPESGSPLAGCRPATGHPGCRPAHGRQGLPHAHPSVRRLAT